MLKLDSRYGGEDISTGENAGHLVVRYAPRRLPSTKPPELRNVQRYGWIPDLPDRRDYIYSPPRQVMARLPRSADLRPDCPPVLDQGELGSCTAHAIANAHRYAQKKQGRRQRFLPSRLFIYYNGRAVGGTVRIDVGAPIRDGIKTIAKHGACPEKFWPYDTVNFSKRPSVEAFKAAGKHQVVLYRRIAQNLSHLRGCLASGYPFAFGMSVYDGFESDEVAESGMLRMPGSKERCLGGHAVLAVGYDDDAQHFIAMNSWSDSWGDEGYFYLPYVYLSDPNLSADFWTLRLAEEE